MSTKMVDALPKNAKNGPSNKNSASNLMIKIKPTEGTSVYRFRLLSFLNGSNTRDWPFIEKFVHEKWDKDAEGKGVYKGFVTCPATRYVRPTLPPKTDPFKACPICAYTNSQFLAYKESGYKDKIAGKIVREFKRKYVALIPVYVVKDPHEPTNINKARVWAIKDREIYEKLNNIIKKQQANTKVFNGGKAVDLFVYVKEEEQIINEGKENEFKYKTTVIEKFGFGKNEYEISNINEKFIDEFPFDDEFYTFSTAEELQKFYNDYVISNSNIPEDGVGDLDDSSSEDASPANAETVVDNDTPEISTDTIIADDLNSIDALIEETVIEEDKVPAKPKTPATTKPAGKPAAPKTVLKEPTMVDSMDIGDIDALIDDISK